MMETDARGARRERIVLAFTGDLESTVAVQWLGEAYDADVVAATVDFGQSRDLEEIRDRALALGALRAHVLDAREEFARAFLLPALRAGVLGDGRHRLASVGQAAVARKLVEIAGIEQANRVAHGGVSAAPRMAAAVRALKPDFHVLAPACEWNMSRDQLVDYAAKRRLPLPAARAAHENTIRSAAAEAAVVDMTFDAGIPVALNGVGMPLLDLIGSLDFLAGKNGIGRGGPLETAVSVLAAAHHELRERAAAGELIEFSRTVAQRYAELVEQGGWFSVLRAALDAYIDRTEQAVNGVVRVKLHEGACEIAHSRIRDAQEDDDDAVVGALRYRA